MTALERMTKAGRYRGCLLGLAVGDALGAPAEFLTIEQIRKKYGPAGITDFQEVGGLKPGCYTDDTQMSLATAAGCIRARQENRDPVEAVYEAYLEWFMSQMDPSKRRGPGNTCMTALGSGKRGSIEKAINNSKGCGGVMRTAPAGLAFGPGEAFRMGAEFAALTHGHPSGYLSAGFLSEMISQIVSGKSLIQAIGLAESELVRHDGHEETIGKIRQAKKLARGNKDVGEAIREIGEGWVGEEALGIALYCALRFPHNWESAVLTSVNHSGDSDSTGSITGAIMGTALGVDSIPSRWVTGVEDSEMIDNIARDLFTVTKDLNG